MKKIAITLTLLCVVAFAQQTGTFKDTRDGKTYKTVKIGEQTWMAENMNHQGKDGKLGLCYDKKPENCKTYGMLYNFEAAKKACPSGWHLPSNIEWQKLVDFAGGNAIAGNKLKAKKGWDIPKCRKVTNENGTSKVELYDCREEPTDEFGFSALPGSWGTFGDNPEAGFHEIGRYGYWWTNSELDASGADIWFMYSGETRIKKGNGGTEKRNLLSVRCVQGDAAAAAKAEADAKAKAEAEANAPIEAAAKLKAEAEAKIKAEADAKEAVLKANSGTFVDSRDKKTYKTIKIGTQTWIAENLTFNANGSKCYNNNPASCEKYGRLYDWKTATTSCPSGWHLPTDAEWDVLVATAGGSATAGEKLKATVIWNGSGKGTDEFGFSALPGGSGNPNFSGVGNFGSFWSATESKDNTKSNYRRMLFTTKNVGSIDDPKTHLFSVRCVKSEQGK